ncbi:hypothetical protein CSA_023556, partial [Cucumis sativus]
IKLSSVYYGTKLTFPSEQLNSDAALKKDSSNLDRSVRMQSSLEMQIFKDRWTDAAKNDRCWIDPYP